MVVALLLDALGNEEDNPFGKIPGIIILPLLPPPETVFMTFALLPASFPVAAIADTVAELLFGMALAELPSPPPPPPPPPPPSSASPPTIAQVMAHASGRNIDDYHGLHDNDPYCSSASGETPKLRSGNSHFRPSSSSHKTAENEAEDVMGAADTALARTIDYSPNADGTEESRVGASPPVSSIRDFGDGGGIQQLSLKDDDGHTVDGYSGGFTIAAGKVVEKKPFLLKGSRREPSSLHRFAATAGVSSAAKATALSPTSALKDTETTKKQSLEALEKMQQEQMDDLEKRMARRREAREQQKRQKQQQQLTNGGIVQHQSPPTDPRRRENAVTIRVPYATDDIDPPGTGATADALPTLGNEVKGLPSPRKTSGSNSKSNNGRGMASSSNVQRSNEKKSKRKGGGRVPLRPRNSSDGTNGGNEEEKKCNDEQWALIKSMRRRQEAALRDAEQERETVQAWAVSERESVKKWADEQRELIRREKHRASTAAMASQRER
mmetsp:Transcript_2197/g.5047  ORF Transcript_2197/g.5047 Transcript_2197/m.5047 type:complete len:496 (-) Transcript_2197:63-1550(-)